MIRLVTSLIFILVERIDAQGTAKPTCELAIIYIYIDCLVRY